MAEITDGIREFVETAVMDNDEVLFQWCMLTTGVSDSDGALVVEMLVKL